MDQPEFRKLLWSLTVPSICLSPLLSININVLTAISRKSFFRTGTKSGLSGPTSHEAGSCCEFSDTHEAAVITFPDGSALGGWPLIVWRADSAESASRF